MEGVLWVNLDPILLVVMGKSVYRPEGRVVFLGGGFVAEGVNFLFVEGTQMHRGNTGST